MLSQQALEREQEQAAKATLAKHVEICAYCNAELDGLPRDPPPVNDDDAWAELAREHGDDCDWIETRGHQRD
jgi:hypothetical protein